MDVGAIERRVDHAVATTVPVSATFGGVRLENVAQLMEFAKLMAVSGVAVPKWLRGNPGGCLAICVRALRWQMCPFGIAEKSYAVTNKGEERIGFEAQLVHAVIEARAPLKSRLRHEIIGEGDERCCRVTGVFRGEDKPHVYTSETLKTLRDARGRNERGEVKGSPLWSTQPEVQLAYSAVRQWCRLFSPDTLLGVHLLSDDDEPANVTPVDGLAQRLRDAKKARVGKRGGFDATQVARVASAIMEGATNRDGAKQEAENESEG